MNNVYVEREREREREKQRERETERDRFFCTQKEQLEGRRENLRFIQSRGKICLFGIFALFQNFRIAIFVLSNLCFRTRKFPSFNLDNNQLLIHSRHRENTVWVDCLRQVLFSVPINPSMPDRSTSIGPELGPFGIF